MPGDATDVGPFARKFLYVTCEISHLDGAAVVIANRVLDEGDSIAARRHPHAAEPARGCRQHVTAIKGTCAILHRELGPLDLNLLGLIVHLNKVVLDITAQPGPGNLLGNLLCAIANLLNSRSPLDILSDALNGLLRVIN